MQTKSLNAPGVRFELPICKDELLFDLGMYDLVTTFTTVYSAVAKAKYTKLRRCSDCALRGMLSKACYRRLENMINNHLKTYSLPVVHHDQQALQQP